MPGDVAAARWPRSRPTGGPNVDAADARRPAATPSPRPSSDGGQPLALDRLDQRVGGVDADQHEHEQEQHHDRAGVDDDLHDAEERACWAT